MSVLFLSTRNSLHFQSQNLLVSLKLKDVPFCFACPENSVNAGFASARSFCFWEFPKNSLVRFFAVKNYVKKNRITHIHVFDEEALKLARMVKKFVPGLCIAGDWHERVLDGTEQNLKKNNPYLYAFVKGKFDVFFCTSPELASFLGKTFKLQNKLGVLPYIPEFTPSSSLLSKKTQAFGFFLHSYCERESDMRIALDAVSGLVREETDRDLFFVFCLEKTSCAEKVLALAEEYGVADKLVCADRDFFGVFYPLCGSVLCVSSDGEGDYSMIYRAWHDSKVLIASDLSVHTKFILSDSMDCALLYPRDDSVSLCKCMQKVLQDKGLFEHLLCGGRQKAGQNLSDMLAREYLKKLNLM